MSVHIHLYIYISIHTHSIYMCVRSYVSALMHACVRACVHTNIYTFIHDSSHTYASLFPGAKKPSRDTYARIVEMTSPSIPASTRWLSARSHTARSMHAFPFIPNLQMWPWQLIRKTERGNSNIKNEKDRSNVTNAYQNIFNNDGDGNLLNLGKISLIYARFLRI